MIIECWHRIFGVHNIPCVRDVCKERDIVSLQVNKEEYLGYE